MKKITYIALAAVLAGALIIGTTLFFTKGKISTTLSFNNTTGERTLTNDERKSYEAKEGITIIELDESSCNINVQIGDVKVPTFSYMEGDKTGKLNITEKGNKIVLEREHSKNHVNIAVIGMDFEDCSTYITLPQSYAGSLDLSSSSGSIKVDGTDCYEDLITQSSSGDITINGVVSKNGVGATATSGSINLQSIKADGFVEVFSRSGTINADAVECSRDCTFKTTSGSIKLSGIAARDISSTSSSGSENLSNIEASGNLAANSTSGSIHLDSIAVGANVSLESSSGSIHFDKFAAGGDLNFKATSGTIKGTIEGQESDYSIMSHSTSGSNNLESTRTGDKKLDVNTTSGSVHISFSK